MIEPPIVVDTGGHIYTTWKVGRWCLLPYPRHPMGCPNFGKKPICPPLAPLVSDVFDLSKRFLFVVVPFNLEEHVETMRQRHPDWTYPQLRNLLYWQSRVNKRLKEAAWDVVDAHFGDKGTVTLCPEGMGVNVIRTLLSVRFSLEVKPRRVVHKVALVGYRMPPDSED